MKGRSCLYVGAVGHRRLRPKGHQLRHSAFWMLLTLDELPQLADRLALFSHNRFNLFAFHDRDHGSQDDRPLRVYVERHLRTAGIDLEGGPIRLLCMPRVFGYGFNPLSVYFCHHVDGSLAALLYEVRNTFGERHSYLMPVEGDNPAVIRQQCDKDFYVSPFMDMALRYDFRVVPPSDAVAVVVSASDAAGPVLVASLTGQRKLLNDGALLRILFQIPLVTLKVMGAIHWHALRMWLKGFVIRDRPAPPRWPVTIVRGSTPRS